MFENMMKYTKAWEMFCEWIEGKYSYEYNKETILFFLPFHWASINYVIPIKIILSIMPFFFDDNDIITTLHNKKHTEFGYKIAEYGIKSGEIHSYENRTEALKKACEKAFELLNRHL